MFPVWIIYIILILIIVVLGTYYKKLSNQKTFLEQFDSNYKNNSVLQNYEIYNASYKNIVDKNNNLENRLANNNYGAYYNSLYTNFSNLNQATGSLADEINRRSTDVTNKINNFNTSLNNDANFVDNNKNNIIQKYNNIVDKNYKDTKGDIQRSLNNVINQNINELANKYVSDIPNNELINKKIDEKYNQGITNTNSQINGMNITFQQALQQNVNDALNNKKKSMPYMDISNNKGILVRIFNLNKSIPIDSICDSKLLPNNECMEMYGSWIGSPIRVNNISKVITGEKVYIMFDGYYTKMVLSSGESRYYQGPISNFKPCDWNNYILTPPGVYKIQLANSSQCQQTQLEQQEINLNNFGTMEKEYIVPSINYYMTSRIDPLFSTNINKNRVLEFLGNILIPQNANVIELKLETASGSRLYFNNIVVIDMFYPNTPVDQTTTSINVTKGNKIRFKLLSYEGVDNSNNYIMLKWRINGQGSFVPIPTEYYYLPNLLKF
jgi:hypothetical protein